MCTVLTALSILQETDKKASGQQAAASSTPPTQRSYADLLRSAQAASAPSAPQSSSAAATTPAQPTSPAAPTPAPRPSGNRSQNKSAQAAAPAASASSDTSGKGEQAGGSLPALDKPAVRPAGSDGPPARPPYSAPGRGVQGYRDDDSSKKAVYVRNIPQVGFWHQHSCSTQVSHDVKPSVLIRSRRHDVIEPRHTSCPLLCQSCMQYHFCCAPWSAQVVCSLFELCTHCSWVCCSWPLSCNVSSTGWTFLRE